jgi:hypothetical protein
MENPMASTSSEISLCCWYITQKDMSELVNDIATIGARGSIVG